MWRWGITDTIFISRSHGINTQPKRRILHFVFIGSGKAFDHRWMTFCSSNIFHTYCFLYNLQICDIQPCFFFSELVNLHINALFSHKCPFSPSRNMCEEHAWFSEFFPAFHFGKNGKIWKMSPIKLACFD